MQKLTLGHLFLFFILLSLSGCTTIHYKSAGTMYTSFSPKKGHIHKQAFEGEKEFYFWGLYPAKHEVYLDEALDAMGLVSAANITIDEYQTLKNKIWTWITFGLFVPKNYKISGFGIRPDEY